MDEQTAEIRKSYEVEKKAHDELKKLDIAKDQFILIAQHHLRTPLTIMKGFLSVVLKSKNKFEPKVIGYVEKISASTNRLAQIVNEFLDIAQFQAGRGLLKIKEIDFYGLINHRRTFFGDEKKLFLKVVPRAEDWPLIPADRENLNRPFSILLIMR